jgi:hypothetical protein
LRLSYGPVDQPWCRRKKAWRNPDLSSKELVKKWARGMCVTFGVSGLEAK